jgi:hypothetical protein
MSLGFTAPPLTEEQREKKRFAKLKAVYGVCGRGGHLQTPENVRWYESVPYCAACVDAGMVTMTTVRWVYFISDGVGHVKIGYSVDVQTRLREIQAHNAFPLTVLAVLKGGSEVERALHERFAEHRVRGEWFRLAPEIIEYLRGLPKPRPRKPPTDVRAHQIAAS